MAGHRLPSSRFERDHLLDRQAARKTPAAVLQKPGGRRFSQEVIGDVLGLSVPHLNRMFARLRKEGLIAVDGHNIEIVDPSALQQLGHFQPLTLARIPAPGGIAAI